jgi:uncharacterized protein YraI
MFGRYRTGSRRSWRVVFGLALVALFAFVLVPARPAAAATPGWTTAVELNVRSGPGRNYSSIDTVRKGTSVLIHSTNAAGDWVNISYNKNGQRSGWVSARYVQRGTQPAPRQVTLTVVNTTGDTIYLLYVSPNTSTDWGIDRLGIDTTLSPGESFSLSVEPGVYDLKAENDDLEILDVDYGLSLYSDYVWYAE